MSAAQFIQTGANQAPLPVEEFFSGLVAVKESTYGTYLALQVSYYAVKAFEAIANTAKPIAQIAGGIAVIEFFDLIDVVKYFGTGKLCTDAKQGLYCQLLGNIAFSGAIVFGAAAWLLELGFGNLASIAASVGSVPVLGAVAQGAAIVGLGPIACILVAVGYFSFAGHDLQTIMQSEIKEEKIQAAISLASRVFNVALYVLIVIPGVNLPAIIVLGLVAKGLGLASFLYGHYTKVVVAAKKAELEKDKKEAVRNHQEEQEKLAALKAELENQRGAVLEGEEKHLKEIRQLLNIAEDLKVTLDKLSPAEGVAI